MFDTFKIASSSQTNDEPPCNDTHHVDTVRLLSCGVTTTPDAQNAGTIPGWARQDCPRGLIGKH